jgi:hypothetical protein
MGVTCWNQTQTKHRENSHVFHLRTPSDSLKSRPEEPHLNNSDSTKGTTVAKTQPQPETMQATIFQQDTKAPAADGILRMGPAR